jgi:acyl-CoA thioesterase YciA
VNSKTSRKESKHPKKPGRLPPRDESLAIRITLLPRDTNQYGSIFGGVILSYIDLAGGIEAHKHAPNRFVTVTMKEVVFHEPVFVGDVVSFYTRVLRMGRTSVTIKIEVIAERYRRKHLRAKVTEAEVTYVCVDDQRRPIPIRN